MSSHPVAPSQFLHEWLAWHAARTPDAPAVMTPTDHLTYAQLAARVRAFAARLAADGVGLGDRVLLALPNWPATIVAGLALNLVGAVSVEVNRAWGAEVLGAIIDRTQAVVVIGTARDVPTWGAILQGRPRLRAWLVHTGPLSERITMALGGHVASLLLADGRLAPDGSPAGEPGPSPEVTGGPRRADDPALVLYTSGSTGTPHGVIQTYRNIDANTRSIVDFLGLTNADRVLVTLPLHYCYGRSLLQTHLAVGGSVYLDDRFAFPRVVLESAGEAGCTGFAGVPLTFEILRRQVDVPSIALPRLRYVTQAGGAMAPETIAWTRQAFAPADLYVMYGQTEATARLSYLPPAMASRKEGSIGVAIPGVRLEVVDGEGATVPTGVVGNLVASGANVTPGYFDDPVATAEILRNGRLWTGDLAVQDEDGYLFYRGRAKEILKVGGQRVSPVEIEQVIARHPTVLEAAVCGVADALLGEVPVAFIVPREGSDVLPADILRFAHGGLPSWAVPVELLITSALPRNEAGKLLRAELAAEYGRRKMPTAPRGDTT